MKPFLRALLVCPLLLAVGLTANAPAANLILNGSFSQLSYSGSQPVSTLFGEVGTGSGSTITVANWTTSGYNFVYAPYTPAGSTTPVSTADSGTSNGANAGAPNEAPGQYNVNNYGSTYLWGTNNGGINAIPATDPQGHNFLAADGAYEVGAFSQTISNLTVGQVYALSFYWAAAQQQGFTMATTEQWQVSMSYPATNPTTTTTQSTPIYNLAAKSFSGWMQQTFYYTAQSTSATLSFLAAGTPTGQPPFVLLGSPSLNAVPEPTAWLLCVGGGAGLLFAAVRRRRRVALACADAAD